MLTKHELTGGEIAARVVAWGHAYKSEESRTKLGRRGSLSRRRSRAVVYRDDDGMLRLTHWRGVAYDWPEWPYHHTRGPNSSLKDASPVYQMGIEPPAAGAVYSTPAVLYDIHDVGAICFRVAAIGDLQWSNGKRLTGAIIVQHYGFSVEEFWIMRPDDWRMFEIGSPELREFEERQADLCLS